MSIIRDGFQSADLDVPVVSPTLNLDFANSQELDPRITFSRGSIGTFVNKNGLIETAAANVPRFDYDPISGECKGLLIEESRTNLFTYSEDFDNVIWTSTFGENAVVTSNQITSPDGNNTADLIRFTPNSTIQSRKTQNVGTQSGTFTVSIFVKAGTLQQILLYVTTSQSPFPSIVYNFNTDTITNNGATGTRTLYPNGWIRLTATATVTSHTMYPGLIAIKPGTLYAWGAQVEAGSFPTSYIPTSGSTVTRSADVASMTGTNFSSWYNQTEGTIYCSANNNPGVTTATSRFFYAFERSDGTSVDFIRKWIWNGATGLLLNSVYTGGRIATEFSTTLETLNKKTAISYKQNYFIRSYNGSTPTTDIVGNLPVGINQVRIGTNLSGTISRLTYYPKALSPAQLQYLTQ